MLQGSPKQVTWAKIIKTERLRHWAQSDPHVFNEVASELNGESSASWWITYREKELCEVRLYIVEGGEKKTIMRPKAIKGI